MSSLMLYQTRVRCRRCGFIQTCLFVSPSRRHPNTAAPSVGGEETLLKQLPLWAPSHAARPAYQLVLRSQTQTEPQCVQQDAGC